MKIGGRIRGPRLGTKILLWGLVLTIVPWLSYRQLLGMEQLLIQGQSQAQLLTAEGISTLFNGRDDLFSDLPVSIQDYESLYARPLQSPIRIDGHNRRLFLELNTVHLVRSRSKQLVAELIRCTPSSKVPQLIDWKET